MLTVVSTDGHQLARARSGEDGAFTLARTGAGRAHLLVVQWRGVARVESLAGTDGARTVGPTSGLVRDVDLTGRVPGAGDAPSLPGAVGVPG